MLDNSRVPLVLDVNLSSQLPYLLRIQDDILLQIFSPFCPEPISISADLDRRSNGRLPRIGVSPPIDRETGAAGMAEAGLELALVADDAESLAFARRQSEVDLHADGVHEEREPAGRSECQTKTGGDLGLIAELRFDCDPAVDGAVGGKVLRVAGFERVSTVVGESDFLARHGAAVAAGRADDEGAEDHDEAQSNDAAGVEPRPQHPGAVLVDLEPLDVVV